MKLHSVYFTGTVFKPVGILLVLPLNHSIFRWLPNPQMTLEKWPDGSPYDNIIYIAEYQSDHNNSSTTLNKNRYTTLNIFIALGLWDTMNC